MNISEAIVQLQQCLAKYGDLPFTPNEFAKDTDAEFSCRERIYVYIDGERENVFEGIEGKYCYQKFSRTYTNLNGVLETVERHYVKNEDIVTKKFIVYK